MLGHPKCSLGDLEDGLSRQCTHNCVIMEQKN